VLGTARELVSTAVGTRHRYEITSTDPMLKATEVEVLAPEEGAAPSIIRFKVTQIPGDGDLISSVSEGQFTEAGLVTLAKRSGDFEQIYSKPFLDLPAQLIEGHTELTSYRSEISFSGEGDPTPSFGENSFTPIGLETVTVPAGTFENCVRVDVRHDAINGDQMWSMHGTTWYKAGVGIVKMIQNPPGRGQAISVLVELPKTAKEQP